MKHFLNHEASSQALVPCLLCSLCGDEICGLERVYIFRGEPICRRCMYFRAQESLKPLHTEDYREKGGWWDDDEADVG